MTKMTKAQLVDENIALRRNNEILRTQLADVNAQLAALSAKATQPQAPAQQSTKRAVYYVTSYTKRDGSRWDVFQTAPNRRVHRPAAA